MITASHLGKDYNGFKFIGKEGIMLSYDVGLDDIADLMKRNIVIGYLETPVEVKNLEEGNMKNGDAIKQTIDFVLAASTMIRKI